VCVCAVQEEDRVVILRFGHDWDATCMQMDEVNTPSLHAGQGSMLPEGRDPLCLPTPLAQVNVSRMV